MPRTLTIEQAKKRITFVTEEVIREDFIGLARRVIKRTPVLTGRTRANWVAGLGRRSRARPKLNRRDPSGQATLAKISERVRKGKMKKKLFLTNSVPWIRKLEFHGRRTTKTAGYWKSARTKRRTRKRGDWTPFAMIRLTAAEHRAIANAAVQRVRQRVR